MKRYIRRIQVSMIHKWLLLLLISIFFFTQKASSQHNVYFCGERIPVDRAFVVDKLMNVIRRQVPLVNLPALRKRAELYFPIVEKYLRMFGLPEDLKYLPIVESGFVGNARSKAGAQGFWQIMPKVALSYGLIISDAKDEREDIDKASNVGCKLLLSNYNNLKKMQQVTSWSLAAAAYNFGIGNVIKAINRQGADYFSMQLNPETAVYVYKIIAVKELFEYPEIYMKNFGYNVFSATASQKIKNDGDENDLAFKNINVEVSTEASKPLEEKQKPPQYIVAHIEGSYKNFKDGGLVKIVLDQDMTTTLGYSRKGYSFSVQGWIIDDRIYMDLGYGHDVVLYDTDLKKGIDLNQLQNRKINILLKNTGYSDEN